MAAWLGACQNEVQGRVERLVADMRPHQIEQDSLQCSSCGSHAPNATSFMSAYIVFSIEKLYEQTVAKGATTRHEQIFIEQFGKWWSNLFASCVKRRKFTRQLHKYVRSGVRPTASRCKPVSIDDFKLFDIRSWTHGRARHAHCLQDVKRKLLSLANKNKPKK
ncbi:hypothetical protein BASA60_001595 [Batrachochytrium salamandrivorans]|nr:hypothetical protein BASA60_001595 [Batrachochytrium salamandrivorans]